MQGKPGARDIRPMEDEHLFMYFLPSLSRKRADGNTGGSRNSPSMSRRSEGESRARRVPRNARHELNSRATQAAGGNYRPDLRVRFLRPVHSWAAERATWIPACERNISLFGAAVIDCGPMTPDPHVFSFQRVWTMSRCFAQIPCVSRRSSNGALSPTIPL